jgi:hypothetical protein
MYATAHRVVSFRNGREGINAFLHVHGRDFPWPGDAATLPESNPGRLEDEIISVKPGGNRVCAYLDILAPDETSREHLLSVLDALPGSISSQENPLVMHRANVTIRFGVELGLASNRLEQLEALTAALRPLLNAWENP